MSDTIKTVDARGLACPEPVVLAKKALESGGFDILEMIVGSASARENVVRYASHAGHGVLGIEDSKDGEWTIRIRRAAGYTNSL